MSVHLRFDEFVKRSHEIPPAKKLPLYLVEARDKTYGFIFEIKLRARNERQALRNAKCYLPSEIDLEEVELSAVLIETRFLGEESLKTQLSTSNL